MLCLHLSSLLTSQHIIILLLAMLGTWLQRCSALKCCQHQTCGVLASWHIRCSPANFPLMTNRILISHLWPRYGELPSCGLCLGIYCSWFFVNQDCQLLLSVTVVVCDLILLLCSSEFVKPLKLATAFLRHYRWQNHHVAFL